jgi:hypothetical protein
MRKSWTWLLMGLLAVQAVARPSLVCRVTARVPFVAARPPGLYSSRIFVQSADLLEERRSGTSLVRKWIVISDTPDQLVAVDPNRSTTLLIDRPGNTFAESGVQVQQRGYCRINDLP